MYALLIPLLVGLAASRMIYQGGMQPYPKGQAPLCESFSVKGINRACAGVYKFEGDEFPGGPKNIYKDYCPDMPKPICRNDETWILKNFPIEGSLPFLGTIFETDEKCDDPEWHWEHFQYNYTCCQCPQGFIVEYPNCQKFQPVRCVSCGKFNEWLFRDPARDFIATCGTIGSGCVVDKEMMRFILDLEDPQPDPNKPPRWHANWFAASEEKGTDKKSTIGFGHNCLQNGDCDKIKAPITEAKAYELLAKDLEKVEIEVAKLPNVDQLNQNQLNVMIDFGYNVGQYAPDKFFKKLMQQKKFDEIGKKLATSALKDSSGKEQLGLKRRRAAEQEKWNTPSDIMSGCPPPFGADGSSIPVLGEDGQPHDGTPTGPDPSKFTVSFEEDVFDPRSREPGADDGTDENIGYDNQHRIDQIIAMLTPGEFPQWPEGGAAVIAEADVRHGEL